jgi:hypothetical protein
VLLYNVTDGETVTGTTLAVTANTPTKLQSAALTVGAAAGNLKNSEKVYEVRVTQAGASGTDITVLGSAFFLVTG